MSTIYELLRAKKGAQYSDDSIEDWSYLHKKPKIDKPASALAGRSRIHGDATNNVQDAVIDILVEIGTRYKFSYRDIAHILLICKVESGFNPDAAAGTTSAAGLGQYTKATVEEAAKTWISKKRLGFILDLSGDHVFDAERGAYGVVLSFMIAKEEAIEDFGKDYEPHLYLYHHEGWYFKPTKDTLASGKVKAVRSIINKSILPMIGPVAALLAGKTSVAFKLLTKDDKPYADQPYVAIQAPAAGKKKPAVVQGGRTNKPQVTVGRTDGQGRTKPIDAPGLSEVLFVILNRDYKSFMDVNKNDSNNVHTVKKGETLGKIAKEEGVSVADLQRLNNIENVNKIAVGQKLVLHDAGYLWRRPPMDLIGSFLKDALNMNSAATPAVVEHKRSHIVLPKGNVAQRHGTDTNVVAIRGGATSQKVAERKKTTDVPHTTVTTNIKKPVVVAPKKTADGKTIEGLLFPLHKRPKESYTVSPRKFGSNRKGGRKHGGIDLYAPKGTIVRAMAAGKVIQVYPFYLGTWVIEVDHGTFIARYGEVSKSNIMVKATHEVKRGQTLGHVGQLQGLNFTMLHLEMYGTNESPLVAGKGLTDRGKLPYQRRSDLIDPTNSINKAVME
jgi:LysM repeat protein